MKRNIATSEDEISIALESLRNIFNTLGFDAITRIQSDSRDSLRRCFNSYCESQNVPRGVYYTALARYRIVEAFSNDLDTNLLGYERNLERARTAFKQRKLY